MVQILKNTCIALNFCELRQGSIPFQRASLSEPKLSVWLSVDEYLIKSPYSSPYSFSGNNLNQYSDPTGDTIEVVGTRMFIKRTLKALEKLQTTAEGKRIYNKLQNSTSVYTIRKFNKNTTKTSCESDLPGNWERGDIGFTGRRKSGGWKFGRGGWIALGHELSHTEDVEDNAVSNATWQTPDGTYTYRMVIYDTENNTYSYSSVDEIGDVPPILIDEIRAVDRENRIRAQAGVELRSHYGVVKISSRNVPSGDPTTIVIYIQQLVIDGKGVHPNYNTNYKDLK